MWCDRKSCTLTSFVRAQSKHNEKMGWTPKKKKPDSISVLILYCIFFTLALAPSRRSSHSFPLFRWVLFEWMNEWIKTQYYLRLLSSMFLCCCHCWCLLSGERIHAANLFAMQSRNGRMRSKMGWNNDKKKGWEKKTHSLTHMHKARIHIHAIFYAISIAILSIWHKTDANAFLLDLSSRFLCCCCLHFLLLCVCFWWREPKKT